MFVMFYMSPANLPPNMKFISRSVRKSVITRTICCFSVRSDVRHVLHEASDPSTKNDLCISFRSKVGDYSHHLLSLDPIRYSTCFTSGTRTPHQNWTSYLDPVENRWLLARHSKVDQSTPGTGPNFSVIPWTNVEVWVHWDFKLVVKMVTYTSPHARMPQTSKSENTKSHALACFRRHFDANGQSRPRFSVVDQTTPDTEPKFSDILVTNVQVWVP